LLQKLEKLAAKQLKSTRPKSIVSDEMSRLAVYFKVGIGRIGWYTVFRISEKDLQLKI
jgi:hypothetical protein